MSGALCLLGLTAPAADAHPLGNFSLNHYLGFTVHPESVEVLAVTDTAEIPTLQEQPSVDRNGDGTVDDAERAAWAGARCTQTAQRLEVTTDQPAATLAWSTESAQFAYQDGAAGLRTSRLECTLRAALHLSAAGTTLHIASGIDPGRVGWNEITARGDGTTLDHADVPARSVSDELRDYPRDLLASPEGVTRAEVHARRGGGATVVGTTVRADGSGPAAWLAGLDARLTRLGAAHRLTLPVGLLAVLLAVVLGAGHALLPGHGKTVMAAYLAGRRGGTRDAVTVGATVTVTHTAGVLVLGLGLTAFSSLAGDVLLGWLGVLSGALVALVGVGLLRDAVRRARASGLVRRAPVTDRPESGAEPAKELAHAATAPTPTSRHDHVHPHAHDHDDHEAGAEHAHHDHHAHDHHDHAHHDQPHGHRHGLLGGSHHHHHEPGSGRRSLIGLGIAGGLVPSPSALVVLLGAVALGRTLFGAALVVAYGVGMAATLTAVGLLLVRVGDRMAGAADGPLLGRLRRFTPYSGLLTALLILTVGLGLMVRSLPSTL
ncbi:high frequency lysogenization protein HflD [Kitasatospora sp. NPDC085879]|uniref:high frequency lysogenization protein HflD n=1 Tax=Kitasatospora sp. NPDC085879 TaxID=3154769 RepID=UPI00342D03D9